MLVLKFIDLQKHASHGKAKCVHLKVIIGEHYINADNQHAKNEKFVASQVQEIILQQVAKAFATKQKHKCVSFATIFHLLKLEPQMIDYKYMKDLFNF